MDSVEFLLNEDLWSLLIDKSLYQNEMIEKKISDFIRDKEEIQKLLSQNPEKKEKYYGFLVYAFIDVKVQQMSYSFKRESEGKYEGMTPDQIAGYKKKIEKFYQNVYGDSIEIVKKILADGAIEEMLELVFSNEKHYHNMMVFLNGEKEEKYIKN
jgi:hypothetical protein